MKYLAHLLLVPLLLWLAGCASVATEPTAASKEVNSAEPLAADGSRRMPQTPASGAKSEKATTQAPVYPTGSLSPITPGATEAAPSVAILNAPADLWERIRRGFAMPDLTSDLVTDREHWYASRPDYIARMTERSSKYLFHIVEELERRNMPSELALLPFIESAFNPQAMSHAKAAGMWQFIPSTGRQYDLKQNAFRDDRRDVLASTRAALDYLQKLHAMFNDWHLALAAYNWGEGSVGRAIAKNQKAGQPTGYIDLNMPMETRFYVPKLQAVKNIVARPSAFQINLPKIDNHPFFDTVTITRDIDVKLAAQLAEVPLQDFKELNPSLNRPVILAAGTPQILLPWDNAAIFQRNLDTYAGPQLSSWTVWVAPKTMKVAEAAKRFSMAESQLRQINSIPPSMLIRAGSALVVPRANHIETDVNEKLADNGQLSLAPENSLRRTVRKAGKKDTVESIAKRFAVSVESVAEWNKLSRTSAFKPGQQVVLYLPAPKTVAKSAKKTSVKSAKKGRSTKSKSKEQLAQR